MGPVPPLHRLQVGALYNPRRTSWPETPHLRIVSGAPVELVLFLNRPTAAEVAAVRTGTARFAWVDADHAALLCYRLDPGIPWSDVPYSPHLEQPGDAAGIDDPTRHTAVTVILVDATTGVVRAIRLVTWPPRFAAAVAETLVRLAAAPFAAAAHDATIAGLYRRYPDTDVLVRKRADVTCTGGTGEAAAGGGPDASPT